MNALDWKLKDGLHHLRDNGRLNVLIALMCHSNARNRCWPSMRLLVKETGWSINEVTAAKDWLIEHGAIELVDYNKRVGDEIGLPKRQHVYQLTGEFTVNGKKHPYFYLAPSEVSSSEISHTEVSSGETEVFQVLSYYQVEEKTSTPATQDVQDTPKAAKYRLLTKAAKDELLPVLFEYGLGKPMASYTPAEITQLMKNRLTAVLKALQPLDDESLITAAELEAAYKWFKKQYRDASYPIGANTLPTLLSNYRASNRVTESNTVPAAPVVKPRPDITPRVGTRRLDALQPLMPRKENN